MSRGFGFAEPDFVYLIMRHLALRYPALLICRIWLFIKLLCFTDFLATDFAVC